MTLNRESFLKVSFFIICLLLISLALVKGFYLLLSLFRYEIPWWMESPSVFGTMALLYFLFDRYFWRWDLFRKIRFIKVPNLNGRWIGSISSSFHNHETQTPAVIEIQQTSSKILVAMYLQESSSKSILSSFVTCDDGQCELHYEYANIPQADAKETMRIHFGTAQLRCYEESDSIFLGGCYYCSARDRATYGTMKFSKEGEKLLRRFSRELL